MNPGDVVQINSSHISDLNRLEIRYFGGDLVILSIREDEALSSFSNGEDFRLVEVMGWRGAKNIYLAKNLNQIGNITQIKAMPRGIGSGYYVGCFCHNLDNSDENCSGLDFSAMNTHDCAMFVESKSDGLNALDWFEFGARLDYRPTEPDWIQLKVSVCNHHLNNLEGVVSDIVKNGNVINREMVKKARGF